MQSNQDLIEKGKAAQKELDRLLERHPELRETQEEIQNRLMNAGTLENRMNVLAIMMEGKIRELQEHLVELGSIINKQS